MNRTRSAAAERTPRWRRLPHIRPQQILQGARKVFAARGLQGTIDDVAREAGVNVGTIYHYFESKEAVFAAVLHEWITQAFVDHQNQILRGEVRAPRGVLRAIGNRAYRFFRTPEYGTLIQVMFGEASRYPRQAELFYREVILQVGLRVAAVIRKGIAAGELRPVDPLIAARGFMGMFFSFAVSQSLLGGDRIRPFAPRRVVEALTEIYLDGLALPASRAGKPAKGPRRRPQP